MSAAAIVGLVVAVVVLAAVVAAVTLMRGGTGLGGVGLKHRFGPEYERALAHHDGDPKATRHELAQRVKRYGTLDLRPLAAQDVEQAEADWSELKAEFVDSPAGAVTGADRLIGRLAEKRGFPESESPEHNDALSVHHPHQLQGYRRAHELAGQATPLGPKATEELRQAMVASREMVDALLGTAPAPASRAAVAVPAVSTPAAVPPPPPAPAPHGTDARAETGDRGGEETAARDDESGDVPDEQSGPHGGDSRRRSPLGTRLAALTATGSRKTDTDARS
ncbi:hypothetical protein [Actinacidiphila rubida]|uniref:Secreted protein n=1 Tax=Actinacidiphila rubida TaxID=310780 RepID=A0A1H8LL15_9ACTN|nr:hypothetical protein [Actinacidiphila rubida]SEO05769.1 hypothetical protein SAMN05216267_101669 [Actinacidiphila rubida]